MIDKIKFAIMTSIPLMLQYIGINYGMFYLFGFLVFLDIVTWVVKSAIVFKNTSSNAGIRGIAVKVFMMILMLALGVFGTLATKVWYVDIDVAKFTDIAILFMSWWELYSIIQNIACIAKNESINEFEAFISVLDTLSWLMKSILDKIKDVLYTIVWKNDRTWSAW
jgi:hypothetical protein